MRIVTNCSSKSWKTIGGLKFRDTFPSYTESVVQDTAQEMSRGIASRVLLNNSIIHYRLDTRTANSIRHCYCTDVAQYVFYKSPYCNTLSRREHLL